MPQPLSESVVVITGASSGIGRAAAHAFAERGARLVLASRDEGSLRDAARECQDRGGRAVVVGADVADLEAVEGLARRAWEQFGRIDVWLNNAGVILYGRLEDTPVRAFCRVISTNLFGQIHGALAVLPYFHRQGRGVLINLCSVWGRITAPYVSSCVTSKFGVRAFSECLRQSLQGSPDIHVCTILPESVDTPIFRHAANYTGCVVKPVPPIAKPERVVSAILDCVERPRREITVGWTGHLLEWGHFLFPGLYSRLVVRVMNTAALGPEGVDHTMGNLFEPSAHLNALRGGWRSAGRGRKIAIWTSALGVAALAEYRHRRVEERSSNERVWTPRVLLQKRAGKGKPRSRQGK